MKVCHMTSAHNQEDIRIFYKECVSLASAGYDVYQISSGSNYEKNGVHLIGIGTKQEKRIKRMTGFAKRIYKKAVEIDADIYHLHDPELLPYGLKLKKQGKIVIFDSHEDIPAQIMDKYWIPSLIRKMVSVVYRKFETYVVKELDAVIVATAHIGEKFRNRCRKIVIVNNYPRLDDIIFHEKEFEKRDAIVCYAGGIDDLRGENIMINAMKKVKGKLIIAGDHEKKDLDEKIRYVGRLNRNEINELYGKAVAGLCILKPIENYYYSKPIKVYEYMAAGLPYICSNFPEWKDVAEASGAGICVDPNDVEGISAAITNIINNRVLGQEMGKKGRRYVLENCNWSIEEEKLKALYGEFE